MDYNEANDTLLRYQEDIRVLKAELNDNRKVLKEKSKQLKSSLRAMNHKKKELDELKDLSFSFILSKITGTYDEKHQKEYEEYTLFKAQHAELESGFVDLKEEMNRQHDEIKRLEKEQNELKEYIYVTYPEGKIMLTEINDRKKELQLIRKELLEAITAVETVINLAREAEKHLSDAKGWSTFDTFFGGGIITDLVKYGKIDDANQYIARISEATDVMQKELQDVDMSIKSKMETISGGEKFMDIAFDNIFSDFNIRGKISLNLNRINDFIEDLLEGSLNLRKRLSEIDRELSRL